MKKWFKRFFPRDVVERREIPGGIGEAAPDRARVELERVRSETAYYEGLSRELKGLRERNHFADNIRATMRGA